MNQPVQLCLNLVLPLDESIDTFTAARIAKVSEITMRRWCNDGVVGACKPVGRWRVDKKSLYALIAAGQNTLQVTQ
jgi:predicted site-specific integrase-resolvase